MEWFLIYLFVMIERVATVLMLGWGAFWFGILLILAAVICSALSADGYGNKTTFIEHWNDHGFVKLCRRMAKWLIPVGLVFGILGFMTPSQKDAAIIVGSGITYNVLTSETGKRIGGKAVELLEQKIDNALTEKVEPTPKDKGKTL